MLDSRGRENFSKVMRRRCCPKCRKRTTTFEMIDDRNYRKQKENLSIYFSLIVNYKAIIRQLKKLEELLS